MPAPVSKHSAPLVLVCGEDDFAVKQRAKQLYLQWAEELGGMDHEIIDAAVSHSGEALKALAKLREALQTLPFFGSGKVIWLKNCTRRLMANTSFTGLPATRPAGSANAGKIPAGNSAWLQSRRRHPARLDVPAQP